MYACVLNSFQRYVKVGQTVQMPKMLKQKYIYLDKLAKKNVSKAENSCFDNVLLYK